MKKIIILALAVALSAFCIQHFLLSKPRKTSVVFIMIDTLRADHLGTYGYSRNTSPNIDTFAKESIVFDYAVASAPWTPPAVASMFTGLYPISHGVIPPNDRELARQDGTALAAEFQTLAEIFKENGYTTLGISPNPWISEEFNFHQGFDTFLFRLRVDAARVVKEGIELLNKAKGDDKPFFLYMHFLDPHEPLNPPQKYSEIIATEPKINGYGEKEEKKIDLYDAEIRFTDQKIGEFFSYLKAEGLYDDVAIVLVADHGEQFMEHGHQGHGLQLYDTELRVPFMFKLPHNKDGRRVGVTANTIDIFPTVLEMAHIPVPANKPGFSLLAEDKISTRRGVYSEINRKLNEQRAFTTPDGMKLILEYDKDNAVNVLGVFNSKVDPKEVSPIMDSELVSSLSVELANARQLAIDGKTQTEVNSRIQVKDSTLEQLKTLGYLQ
jgi:arylsulfatase A-like enzyme